jgi:parvulin-like peptidyl-prolyl isomerase
MTRSGGRWGYVRELGAAVLIVGACLAWRATRPDPLAVATPPSTRATAAKPAKVAAAVDAEQRPVALVNGVEITQGRLATECLSRHGATVLETMVNRRIIEQACRRAGVTISAADVDAEIDVMARRFSLPRDKWLDLIRQERGVTERQYADDIVWPMLALRRLASAAIEPTPEDLQQSFEQQFGPAVKARIVVLRTRGEAEEVRRLAVAAPDEFPSLARTRSIDVGSASANGWVQPIRLHSGEPQFDHAAFSLRPGEISQVVQVADQFIVIKCEGHLPADTVTFDSVRERLAAELRDQKSRQASTDFFRRLQDAATVENVLNDPDRGTATEDVAARVNGEPVPLADVRAACLDRHGLDVLEVLISRALIEQALARSQLTVVKADLDAEITRAAESLGFRRADGTADVDAWMQRVTRDEKIPMRHYLDDVVWPTVALKKLVGSVPVTDEDLQRAHEATFGPRARCRIVVLDNQRRAQEVWQLARQNPTSEHVGALAEQYSVDPTSRALRGEVPPIRRYGGQPTLEREAFALDPGELSGVVQVADRFMIIFREGSTEAAAVTLAESRSELYADILEKKQRIQMSRHFVHLRESAAIDNMLAGTSQSPVKPAVGGAAGPDMPGAVLDRLPREASAPRAGSRRAADAAGQGVVPAGFEAPGGAAPQPPSGPRSATGPIRR